MLQVFRTIEVCPSHTMNSFGLWSSSKC